VNLSAANPKMAGMLLAVCLAATANSGGRQQKEPGAQAPRQQERRCCDAMPQTKTKEPPQERPDVERFAARVETILTTQNSSKAEWGILIQDEVTGETLFERNAQKYFSPASNLKLFTTALALATLGPDFTFTTSVEATGDVSSDGRVNGDLILTGAGDPNLSNRRFPFVKQVERDGPAEKVLAQFADALVARGVKQVDGDVIADDSLYSCERYPSGWEIDDMVWSYGAAVSALSVNDNTVTLTLSAGEQDGGATSYTVEPWSDEIEVENNVVTGPAGAKPELALVREPGSRRVTLRGTLPAHSAPRTLVLAVEQPAENAAHLLKHLLEARGVRITGSARARHWPEAQPKTSIRLAEHTSVPLADALPAVNKMSQNLHAEMLFRFAARTSGGAMTLEDALKFAAGFYESMGINKNDLVLQDGSGLSRRNLVTPEAVVALLQYAAKQPRWADAYKASLPIAGEDGTLADRLKNTSAAGRIRAKTGTLEHVMAVSGYATTLAGERLVFSMFGNNFGGKNHDGTSVLDAICQAMVDELGARPPAPERRGN
jgi:D-alanyl-D-alanine carboxypeptidase/D-alanyl-D-alanine-endopeptidase (penicillin-binding protein 4)